MVQSINIKAITTLATIIRRPYLISPHVYVRDISEVNFLALREFCGIRAILFDKDNTLTSPYCNEIHEKAKKGFADALEIFGSENVAIISNSAGTDDDLNYKDAEEIENQLNIAVIRHKEKKPGGIKEVLGHFNDVDCPEQIAMVGDRLLTDVVFGNLYGMLTIHTQPLCQGSENKNDNLIARVLRSIENYVLYGNWFGGRLILRNTMKHATWPGEKERSLVLNHSKLNNKHTS